MANHLPKPILNRLLSRLSAADFAHLEPHLEAVDLPLRKILETRNRAVESIYFLEHGFASVVANGNSEGIEIGLIGREGMTGLPIILGSDRTPHDTFIQSAGAGWRMPSENLRGAMTASSTLRDTLLLFVQTFTIQASHTAIANGRGKLEERLARWLLMAHDRLDDDRLDLTQEFLSQMLSVRRAGVTVALGLLAKTGTIKVERGSISILDRAGLEEESNGTYGIPEKEYERLLG